jgi:transcriptional regulator with XRE-family HTH domain
MTTVSEVDIPTRHLMITQRLRQRRDDLGLTQKQVVTRLGKCGLHTTNRALSSLEHGTGLDVAKLPELAAALDCTITYLLGLTSDPHNWHPDEAVLVPARGPMLEIPVSAPQATPPAAPAAKGTTPHSSLILGEDVPTRSLRR